MATIIGIFFQNSEMSNLVRCLHKKSGNQCLPNIDIVLLRGKVTAPSGEGKPVHNTRQLLTSVVRAKYLG